MDAGARVIHFDVMDGHFVPPITIGPLVARRRSPTRSTPPAAPIDVHLMIEAPERQIEEFAKAGADSITFHEEATPHANRTLAAIRELGCLAGVAINPGTPVEAVAELRGLADIVLCMTVNPGWGGQSFIAGLARQGRAPARRSSARPGSRSTAASTPPPPARSPPPAPPSSSPAPPSSAPPTRPPPTPAIAAAAERERSGRRERRALHASDRGRRYAPVVSPSRSGRR